MIKQNDEALLFEHPIEDFGSIVVYSGNQLSAALKVGDREYPVECRLVLDREGKLDDPSRALLTRVLQHDLGLDANKATLILQAFASREFVEKIKSSRTNAILIKPQSISFKDIAKALDITIKKDIATKVITFCAFVLAKTENDQINLGFQSESSTGKTYIPLEIASYFPPEDIIKIAGASPTSFFHEYGTWDDERKVNVINLEGKVLIFLDFPDYRLIEKLRPLLSHDEKVLTFKITDKNEKHGLRTKTVELIGFPTVIFCSTKLNPDEQEKTRLLILSPEISQEKLDESLKLIALKVSDPSAYTKMVSSDKRRLWLESIARDVWESGIKRIKIDGDLFKEFVKRWPVHRPKHQRDLPRIASLIKAHALLNHSLREFDNDGTLIANHDDIKAGLELYEKVALPNELGISPYVLEIFENEIKPLLKKEGITRKEVYAKHFQITNRFANPSWYEHEIFPALITAGLIIEEPDPDDRRRKLIYPPDSTAVIGAKNAQNKGKVSKSNINNSSKVRGVEATCSLCGAVGPGKLTPEGHFACIKCLKESEVATQEGVRTPTQGNAPKIQNEEGSTTPPEQPQPKAHLIYPSCSVCGKILNGISEPIYTANKVHYCKEHFPGKREERKE